jgi:hypothetical protein
LEYVARRRYDELVRVGINCRRQLIASGIDSIQVLNDLVNACGGRMLKLVNFDITGRRISAFFPPRLGGLISKVFLFSRRG